MRYSIDFLRKCDGVECFLEADRGRRGRGIITVEHNDIYVCQNFADGSSCSNKRGYQWSYVVNSMGQDWFLESVESIEIFPTVKQCYDLKIAITCMDEDQYQKINTATGSRFEVCPTYSTFLEVFIKNWGETNRNNCDYATTEKWFERRGSIDAKTKAELTIPFKNVIFEEKMEDKKQIGWKLKSEFSLFESSIASLILSYGTTRLSVYSEGYNFSTTSEVESRAKQFNVLDLWFEPVYKNSDIIIEDYTMTKDNVIKEHVRFGCVTVDTGYLDDAYKGLKGSIISGDRKVEGVYLSNGTKISLDKIKEILDY